MPRLSRIAFWAAAAFVFAVPWERTVAVPLFGGAGTVFGGVAFLLVVASLVDNGKIRLRAPSAVLAVMALFVLWSALTWFWSINPSATADRTATYAQLFLMAWLIWQVCRGDRKFHILLQAYVLGCTFAIVAVILNFIRGEATITSAWTGLTRFSFGGGDPNYFALSIVLGIPMAWQLLFRDHHRTLTIVNVLYIPLAVIVVGLTGSRGGAISTLVSLLIIPVTYWHLGLGRKLLLILALAGAVYGAFFVIPDATIARFVETPDDIAAENLAGRVDIWRSGLAYLSEHPRAVFTGVGSGTYAYAVENLLGRRATGHNAYLNVLVDNGLVGLTLLLAVFALALVPNLGAHSRARSFALFLTLSLAVGVFALSWEREKTLWIVFALLASHRSVVLVPFLSRMRVPHIRRADAGPTDRAVGDRNLGRPS